MMIETNARGDDPYNYQIIVKNGKIVEIYGGNFREGGLIWKESYDNPSLKQELINSVALADSKAYTKLCDRCYNEKLYSLATIQNENNQKLLYSLEEKIDKQKKLIKKLEAEKSKLLSIIT